MSVGTGGKFVVGGKMTKLEKNNEGSLGDESAWKRGEELGF